MAPSRTSRSAGGSSARSSKQAKFQAQDSEEEEELDNMETQTSEEPDMANMMSVMLDQSRRRRETKRKAIQKNHQDRVEKLRSDIKARYKEEQLKTNKSKARTLEKLAQLMERKQELESKIHTNAEHLRYALKSRTKELQLVLGYRVQEIGKAVEEPVDGRDPMQVDD
ncbi:hypothetical protein K402DRAFT_408073 [Aulographum hederae CBS 113979]|uniref:Uncharacterized protein n=1 Tax=Aulographum hederae CBS 113979 TaxID=1176131 RepID=A0A6G1GLK8_9PEZI|nr:hypothetical protein K402DRAFT_408073 [Aulographum hederae CBS 113979]